MAAKRKYKSDPVGVQLMHLSFPEAENQTAVKKIQENRSAIKTSAKNLFYKYKVTFDKVGIRIEDVESFLSSNAYVAFSKPKPLEADFLPAFLKQRGLKLANSFKKIAATIVEDVIPQEDVYIDDLIVDNANPEEILMAKEEAAFRSREIQGKLIIRSREYVQNFIDKNSVALVAARISSETVFEIVNGAAVEFASSLYRQNGAIRFSDFGRFKKILSVRMSRFVKELSA